ncbi:MAG: F0F1 ATP synthase subunit A [Bacteroidetes bacterium]|nr:F0F1 ATP synthase subunit A [Bacteroidota bacterium]
MNRLLASLRGISLLIALLVVAAPAAHASGDEEKLDALHHTSDGYYVDFSPFGAWELPRLFVVRRADGSLGFDAFASTKAALLSHRYVGTLEGHGAAHEEAAPHAVDHTSPADTTHAAAAAEHGTNDHGHAATSTTAEALIANHQHLDATLSPADGGKIVLDLSFTRHLLFMLIGSTLLLVWALAMSRRYRAGTGRTSAPRGKLQNAFEALVQFVRNDIAQPNIGEKADKFVPYLLTAFFFILILNFLGLLPFGATATANIAVTAVLALFTFFATNLFASKDYWKHIFWPPGVPTFVKPILIPVEVMGLFTKPFALAIRLFANMTAGHLVILNLIGLIFVFSNLFGTGAGLGVAPVSVAMALFIYLLEILVAFLQAYVFTMLSAIFIGMAVASHDDHGHDHDHGPGARHDLHPAGDVDQLNGQMALTA